MKIYPQHEPYHIRRLEQQQLDVLLRIEQLLVAHFDADNRPSTPPEAPWVEPVKQEQEPPTAKGSGFNKRRR